LFSVEVRVGAVPAGHLNDAGHVTARAVPSAMNTSTKLDVSPEACVFDSVIDVIAAFRDTANTAEALRSNVNEPAEIDTVVCLSAVFNGKKTRLLSTTVVPLT